MRTPSLLLSCAMAWSIGAAAAPFDLRYQIRALPASVHDVTDITDDMSVGGAEWVSRNGGVYSEPFLFGPDGRIDVAGLFPGYGPVTAITNLSRAGSLVGVIGSGTEQYGFYAPAGASAPLRLAPPGGAPLVPTAVSDHLGQAQPYVVGWASDEFTVRAFRWSPATGTQPLGTLGGDDSEARDVNAHGHVVGAADTANGYAHAFLRSGTRNVDIGVLMSAWPSAANAINDAGLVVGAVLLEGMLDGPRAFLYQDGQVTLLDGPARAEDVNNLGWVVGSTNSSDLLLSRGFVYADGQLRDLNTLINPDSGWTIMNAYSINATGDVVGRGCRANGECRYLIMAAIPEPAGWALLLAGLPVLGVLRQRRRGGA